MPVFLIKETVERLRIEMYNHPDTRYCGTALIFPPDLCFKEKVMFTVNDVFPGIRHITDAMGVSFTLIEGSERAILFDTGYGMEDVGAYVQSLTDKQVKVLLSHGHHDHMLGARWFETTWLCGEDMEEFRERTGALQRTKVIKQAEGAGVPVPGDFMEAVIPAPKPIRFTGKSGRFDSMAEQLGGLEVRVLRVPGHTPGSVLLYIPSYGLLLTGDDWNPCTWMWFPSSLRADEWRENMKEALDILAAESGSDVRTVICSHQPKAREGCELKAFLEYMTPERMKEAPPVDMGAPINTHQIVKGEWTLLFDLDKIRG